VAELSRKRYLPQNAVVCPLDGDHEIFKIEIEDAAVTRHYKCTAGTFGSLSRGPGTTTLALRHWTPQMEGARQPHVAASTCIA
jgi:hypothetical protein